MALGAVIAVSSCSFDDPQAPRWDTRLTIPLINRYYTMDDLIEDEPSLAADSAGQMYYFYVTELEPFQVGNQLTFADFSGSYRTSIGQVSLASPGDASINPTLLEIYPPAGALDGQTAVVPAFSFDLGKRALPAYQEFEWVEVAAGAIRIQVLNNLPVGLGRPLDFAIYDAAADTLVGAVALNEEVLPGGLLNLEIDLAGKRFSNALSIEASGNSPGSRNQPVHINAADSFTLNVAIGDLRITSGRARLGPQEIDDGNAALVDASASIVSARIKQGVVRTEIISALPIPATLEITMPDFKTPDGTIFSEAFVLTGTGGVSRTIDFAGFSYTPEPAPLGEQTVRLMWSIHSPGSNGNAVTVHSSDDVSVKFDIDGIIFSEVDGTFQGKPVQIDPRSYTIDVPDAVDSVRFDNVQLDLVLRNSIGFPAQIDLLLDGVNESGRHVFMRVQESILAAGANGSPAETRIRLDKSNSNVVEFINALPKSINVSGVAVIGDAGHVGAVRETDAVSGTMSFDAPLFFVLSSQSHETESESIEIDQEAREQIRDNLHEGTLDARLANHLPVGATVSFYFGRSKASTFVNPLLVVGPVTVDAGDVDAATGLVVRPRMNEPNIPLTEKQLRTFATSPLFGAVRIDFPGTNGRQVRMVRSDYIDIKAVATVNFTVDPETID